MGRQEKDRNEGPRTITSIFDGQNGQPEEPAASYQDHSPRTPARLGNTLVEEPVEACPC